MIATTNRFVRGDMPPAVAPPPHQSYIVMLDSGAYTVFRQGTGPAANGSPTATRS